MQIEPSISSSALGLATVRPSFLRQVLPRRPDRVRRDGVGLSRDRRPARPTDLGLNRWLPFRIVRGSGTGGTYVIRDATGVSSDPRGNATVGANLGNIAYEMTLFATRAGAALTPQLINELKNSLGD